MLDQCEFVGFKASTHLSTRLKSLLNQILSIAPSDSGVRMRLIKEGEHFHGEWRVASINGQFEAQGQSNNPEDLVETLFQQMSKKLLVWNQQRPQIS